MEELIARLGVIFSQLGDQVRAAMANADAGGALKAAIDVILPVACGVLRVLAVVVAILLIVRCLMSLFRDKPGKEIWGWLTLADGTRLDLYHWENALGRGRWADVSLDFPTVSRSHAALLRDDKGNWRLQPPANQKRHPDQREKCDQYRPGQDGRRDRPGRHRPALLCHQRAGGAGAGHALRRGRAAPEPR